MTVPDQVVVGVGNPIMGDDGLGKHVIDRLPVAEMDAQACFAGTTAFLALEAMDGADRAVVVDAVDVPGAEPGSIQRHPLAGDPDRDSGIEVLMHDFSLGDAIEMGTTAYDLPEAMILLGIVPEQIAAGDRLSETVRTRVPELVARVLDELEAPLETIEQ